MTPCVSCPAENLTHLLDKALLVLLFKYEVLQLQVNIPAWPLRGCLLLTAAGRLSACAVGCVPCTPCWSAEAISVAYFVYQALKRAAAS